jgi:hypothetical protein
MTDDDMDKPEEEGYGLLYPFTVVTSAGGQYDDDAFVAGVEVGRIDMGLKIARVTGADRYRAVVRTDLVKQLDLVGMARGWPVLRATADETYPEWSVAEFFTESDGDGS